MDLTQVGYLSKTHGVKGHLILRVERNFDADSLKALFVESPTGKAPYFISEIKASNNGLIVGLEEITAVEKARSLIGKAVFIDTSLLEEEEEEADWIGFELIDKHHGSLGHISSVSDNGEQALVSLQYKGKEVILPMVEDFIENIDEAAKKLYFNAPEGLIDLYLAGDVQGTKDEQE